MEFFAAGGFHLSPYIAYGLFAAYGLCLAYGMLAPPKQPDPQRGMAIGCLMFAALFLALGTILYTVGLFLKLAWLTDAVSAALLFVAFFILLSFVEVGVKKLKRR